MPGTQVFSRLNNAFTPGPNPGDFVIPLSPPVTLGPGSYWVSVQAVQNAGPAGQWVWRDRTVTSMNGAAWINPGGGFGLPTCVNWNRRTACVATGTAKPDQVFRLLGSLAPPTLTPTATLTPQRPRRPPRRPQPRRHRRPPHAHADATPTCILGDINCDGVRGHPRLRACGGRTSGQTNCGNPADLDGNCIVDIRDYGIWRQNFGHTAGAAPPGRCASGGWPPHRRARPGPALLGSDQAAAGSRACWPADVLVPPCRWSRWWAGCSGSGGWPGGGRAVRLEESSALARAGVTRATGRRKLKWSLNLWYSIALCASRRPEGVTLRWRNHA